MNFLGFIVLLLICDINLQTFGLGLDGTQVIVVLSLEARRAQYIRRSAVLTGRQALLLY